MNGAEFIKMHGLGNDFVVLDMRARPRRLDGAVARAIADRHTGVGCDQLIAIEPSDSGMADAQMRILNADGTPAEACGNAARCVASLLMDETGTDHVVLETVYGLLDAEARPDGLVAVDMGRARTGWEEIPLSESCDTLHLPVAEGALADPVAVNIGNPHAVFFVDDAEKVDLARLGPRVQKNPLFPEGVNVGVASIAGGNRLRLRVCERGVGITRACGSGACAAGVAAARRGLAERKVTVVLDGGELAIEWLEDGHVMMTGPAVVSFRGTFDPALLGEDAA